MIKELKSYKIAIIIPAIKRKFLDKTLKSIFAQTIDNFHVYIGNDSSNDDLTSIIKKFPSDKITYKIFSDNIGAIDLVAHWKRCISMTSNEPWIWLFSDDDYLSPDCIEQFISIAQQKQNLFYRFQTKKVGEDDCVMTENILPPTISTEEFLQRKLNYLIESYIIECIFSRKMLPVFNQIPHTPLAWCFDDMLWVRFSLESAIVTIPNAYVSWRFSGINISGRIDNNKTALDKLDACIIYVDYLKKIKILANKQVCTYLKRWIEKQYLSKVHYLKEISLVEEYFQKILSKFEDISSIKYIVPATLEQKQCWDYHMQEGEHISPQVLYFEYKMQALSLEQAKDIVIKMIKTNDSLRLSFEYDDELNLIVGNYNQSNNYFQILSFDNNKDFETCREEFITKNEKSLDIRKNRIFQKIYLIRVSEFEYIIFVFMHHLLSDEYSLSILKKQLESNFQLGTEHSDASIAAYALWQKQQWNFTKDTIKEYWCNKLSPIVNSNFNIYTYHKAKNKEYSKSVFESILNNSNGSLYRTSLPLSSYYAFRSIQHEKMHSLLCIFFYAFRFLFYLKFKVDRILVSSPLRNVTKKKFANTIGYLSGGLYSFDFFRNPTHMKEELESFYLELLQSMRFLIANHKGYGLTESNLRLSNAIYINIMPKNHNVGINPQEYMDVFIPNVNATYYPLELYIIEKEDKVFLEYAFNNVLYSQKDITYIQESLCETLNTMNEYD